MIPQKVNEYGDVELVTERFLKGEITSGKFMDMSETPVPNGEPFKIEEDKKVINHPQRYGGDTTYECIKVLKAWLTHEEYLGFLKGTAIKYICRLGKKDEAVQEIEKSEWYLNKLKEEYQKEMTKDEMIVEAENRG